MECVINTFYIHHRNKANKIINFTFFNYMQFLHKPRVDGILNLPVLGLLSLHHGEKFNVQKMAVLGICVRSLFLKKNFILFILRYASLIVSLSLLRSSQNVNDSDKVEVL